MQTIAKTGSSLKVLALTLAVVNLMLFCAAPWLRDAFDAMTGRLSSPLRPSVGFGVQELLVYYDPWLARGVFPIVYTLGFAAIAFLFQLDPDAVGSISTSAALAVLLLSFESVWILLMAFTVFFRGPDWNFYWPWEAWTPKLVSLNTMNFSDVFWRYLVGRQFPPTPPVVREAPGLFLAAGYFLFGLLIARSLSRRNGYTTAYCCFVLVPLFTLAPLSLPIIGTPENSGFGAKITFLLLLTGSIILASYPFYRLLKPGNRRQATGRSLVYGRAVLIVFLVQAAALVPVKMLLYWVFNMKYFVYLPKYVNL